MLNTEQLNHVAKVLSYTGPLDKAPADISGDVRSLDTRYENLKIGLIRQEAKRIAILEWLEIYFAANEPEPEDYYEPYRCSC